MKKMNFFTRFLVGCAGADHLTLKQCTSAEVRKMTIIGSCVLIPATLGIVSGTFAMFTFSNNLRMSVGFGCIWGFIVFLIDRAVVAATRPGEFNLGVIARMVLACIFAFVISVPLELRVFQDAIHEKLSANLNGNIKSIHSDYDNQVSIINENINEEKTKVDALRAEFIGEVDGTTGSQKPYRGPIAREKEKIWNEETEFYTKLSTSKQKEIEAINRQRDEKIRMATDGQAQGFLGQMRALGDLSKEDNTVFWGVWLIRLFFLSVELIPILIKLGSGKQGDAYYSIANKNSEIAIAVNDQLMQVRAEEMVHQQKAQFSKEMHELQFEEERALMDSQQKRSNYFMEQLKKSCDRKLQMQQYIFSTVKDERMRDDLIEQVESIYQDLQTTLMNISNKQPKGANFVGGLS